MLQLSRRPPKPQKLLDWPHCQCNIPTINLTLQLEPSYFLTSTCRRCLRGCRHHQTKRWISPKALQILARRNGLRNLARMIHSGHSQNRSQSPSSSWLMLLRATRQCSTC